MVAQFQELAHNPLLLVAGSEKMDTRVPWIGRRKLRPLGAEPANCQGRRHTRKSSLVLPRAKRVTAGRLHMTERREHKSLARRVVLLWPYAVSIGLLAVGIGAFVYMAKARRSAGQASLPDPGRLVSAFRAERVEHQTAVTAYGTTQAGTIWTAIAEVAGRAVEVRDVSTLADRAAFDLITAFDAIHDQAQPADVLAGIADAIRPDGVFLMQDICASSHVEGNVDHPIGTFLCTISCMHCMSVSLAGGGPGLGAMWGEELALKMLRKAGFNSIRVEQLDHDIQNSYYIATRL